MKDLITQLRAMRFERPESIIHGLDLLNFHFNNEDYSFSPSNKLIHLGEQFDSVKLSMSEKIKIVNSIFFEKEQLFIGSDEFSSLYLKHLFGHYKGDADLLSMIYQFMLAKMKVKFKIWSVDQPHLIKVCDESSSFVVNLMEKGQKAKGRDLSSPADNSLILPVDQLYNLLSKIADQLLMKSNYTKTLEAYDCILEIFPEKVVWYGRRGLLKKNLGLLPAALIDLEKYTTYVSKSSLSVNILETLVELRGLNHLPDATKALPH